MKGRYKKTIAVCILFQKSTEMKWLVNGFFFFLFKSVEKLFFTIRYPCAHSQPFRAFFVYYCARRADIISGACMMILWMHALMPYVLRECKQRFTLYT